MPLPFLVALGIVPVVGFLTTVVVFFVVVVLPSNFSAAALLPLFENLQLWLPI
jgi:hypothetical protein